MRFLTNSTLSAKTDLTASEKYGIPSVSLVREAAKAVYKRVLFIESRRGSRFSAFFIVCGAGKNGSDGYALAEKLASEGRSFRLLPCFPPKAPESEEILSGSAGELISFRTDKDPDDFFRELEKAVTDGTDCAVIDCLFGTGLKRRSEPSPLVSRVISGINGSSAFVLSADVPSGVSADTGEIVTDEAVRADAVCTFMRSKPGLEVTPGISYCGEIFTEVLPSLVDAEKECVYNDFVTEDDVFSKLPKRFDDSNKGSYGRVTALCGSKDMPGALCLSASAALRTGPGLVQLLGDGDTLSYIKCRISEPVFTTLERENGSYTAGAANAAGACAARATCLLSGCGVGYDPSAADVFRTMCELSSCPAVIDADMMLMLSGDDKFFKKHGSRVILTPHPGEAARMLGVTAGRINSDRISAVRALSEKYGCTVLLKGRRTVICSPTGFIAVNPTGNSGMSKGGSGDVLAGIIASFAAQGVSPFDSAVLGAYVHGLAGDMAKEKFGERWFLPSDMISCLSDVFKKHDKT